MAMGNVGPGTVMFDLGSGDGKVVLEAASRGATVTGLELRQNLNDEATAEAARRGLSSLATFRSENFFEADLSSANLVYMYLIPEVVEALAPALFSTLKPGTVIISHDYYLNPYVALESWWTEAFVEEKTKITGTNLSILHKYVVDDMGHETTGLPLAVDTVAIDVRHAFFAQHPHDFKISRQLSATSGGFDGFVQLLGRNSLVDRVEFTGEVSVVLRFVVATATGIELAAGVLESDLIVNITPQPVPLNSAIVVTLSEVQEEAKDEI